MRPVVIVPSTLALLPEYAGIEEAIPELRAACGDAVGWLVDNAPEAVSVLTAESAGLRIGGQLLAEAGFEGLLAAAIPAAGVLVVANGSATRTEKAPGHLDPRAQEFDADLEAALRSGDSEALRALDESLGRELWCHGVPAFQTLGQLWLSDVEAEVNYADDPYGVQYWVVRWACVS
jgi:hypothetical protein